MGYLIYISKLNKRSIIDMSHHKELVEVLKTLVADLYHVQLKTQNVHWNVTGPQFQSIHLMTETQYTEAFNSVDEVAELIRTLGERAPGSFSEYAELTSIDDNQMFGFKAEDMLKELINSNKALLLTTEKAFEMAQKAEHEPSVGLLSAELSRLEKNIWMLNSSL